MWRPESILLVPRRDLYTLLSILELKVRSCTHYKLYTLTFAGGTPPQSWVLRACIITGTQQVLIAFLWYWGATLTHGGLSTSASNAPSPVILTSITLPLAVLMWIIGILLFFGLPNYYRQKLGVISSFYSSLCRKGVVLVSIPSPLFCRYQATHTNTISGSGSWSSFKVTGSLVPMAGIGHSYGPPSMPPVGALPVW